MTVYPAQDQDPDFPNIACEPIAGLHELTLNLFLQLQLSMF